MYIHKMLLNQMTTKLLKVNTHYFFPSSLVSDVFASLMYRVCVHVMCVLNEV